jgi:hypothetical protein
MSAPVFDHITSDVTVTSTGASIETVTNYDATTSNTLGRRLTTVSADGLTTTVANAFTRRASGVRRLNRTTRRRRLTAGRRSELYFCFCHRGRESIRKAKGC